MLGGFATSLLLGRVQDRDLDLDNILMYVKYWCSMLFNNILLLLLALLSVSDGARDELLLNLCVPSSFPHDCTCVKLVTALQNLSGP